MAVYPGIWIFWFIMHSNIDRWRKLGRASYGIAGLPGLLLCSAVLFYRDSIFAVRWPSGTVVMLAGVAAFVAALVVGGLASRVMPARTLVGVAELEPQRVRQPILKTGIYSRTRNPIYLAHWLLIFSMAALSGFAASWILFAVDCLIIPLMILSEERELRARYGQEFKTYMSHVPRFFPKL